LKNEWFVQHRGRISGPYTESQVQAMRGRGTIDSFARVSRDQADWQPIDLMSQSDTFLEASGSPSAADIPSQATLPPAFNSNKTDGLAISAWILVFPLLLLHYFTLGVFTFFWTTRLHGFLPKNETRDLSKGKAIGLCFVPIYNIYWFFVVYPALATRVNELSKQCQLRSTVPVALGYLVAVLLAIPIAAALVGSAVLLMLFSSTESKQDVFLFFFYLPQMFTVINIFLVTPMFAVAIQVAVNHVIVAQMRQRNLK
jgi:hypothetical protein